jgi:hypothetical protein
MKARRCDPPPAAEPRGFVRGQRFLDVPHPLRRAADSIISAWQFSTKWKNMGHELNQNAAKTLKNGAFA